MSMNLGEQTGRTGQPRRTEQTGRSGRLGLIVQRELPWEGTRVHG